MCKKSSYHCNNIQKGFSSLASYYTDMNWTSIATQQVYIKKTIFATIIWLDYYRLYRNKFGYMSLMAHCNTMQLRPTRHHCITPIKSKVVDFKMKKKTVFLFLSSAIIVYHAAAPCLCWSHEQTTSFCLLALDSINFFGHFACSIVRMHIFSLDTNFTLLKLIVLVCVRCKKQQLYLLSH